MIDEDLNKRLVTELNKRGRQTYGIREFGLRGSFDPAVLNEVFSRFENPVLITGDDHMPDHHAVVIDKLDATIAVVAPCAPHDPLEDAYEREVVHKWVHVMHEQERGSIRRYHLRGSVKWTTRKR